jgi:hypothetical protein
MLRVFNARGQAVKSLRVDLGIQARPMAIFTLKNRTLNPVVERFIETVRTVGKSMSAGSL